MKTDSAINNRHFLQKLTVVAGYKQSEPAATVYKFKASDVVSAFIKNLETGDREKIYNAARGRKKSKPDAEINAHLLDGLNDFRKNTNRNSAYYAWMFERMFDPEERVLFALSLIHQGKKLSDFKIKNFTP